MKNFDVQYFIDKFTKIDSKFWCINSLQLWSETDKCYKYCSLGHLGVYQEEDECGNKHYIHSEASSALTVLIRNYFRSKNPKLKTLTVELVNDGMFAGFHDESLIKDFRHFCTNPRDRILFLLFKIKYYNDIQRN